MSLEHAPRKIQVEEIKQNIIASSRYQSLDLFGTNELFNNFHQMRAKKEWPKIHDSTRKKFDEIGQIDLASLRPLQQIVLHRDLARLLSIVVHSPGSEASTNDVDQVVPGSGRIMLRLSEATGFPPRTSDALELASGPHDHLYSLAMTSIGGEEVFVENIFTIPVNEAGRVQPGIVKCITELAELPVTSPEATALMKQATALFSVMTATAVVNKEHLPPEFFFQEIFPFLRPLVINGKVYKQTGSQMAGVIIADLKFIGMNNFIIPGYDEYVRDNLVVVPNSSEPVLDKLFGLVPGLSGMSEEEKKVRMRAFFKSSDVNVKNAIKAAHLLVNEMYMFRKIHLSSILESLSSRPDGQSTGGNIDLPGLLVAETWKKLAQIKLFGGLQ